MSNLKEKAVLFIIGIFVLSGNFVGAESSRIGVLVFDGFLTSDVTAPVEVFGAAVKKEWFADHEVVVISVSKNKEVKSEEGLRVIADISIYDIVDLDVLIVPSAYEMDHLLKNKDLIGFIKKQAESVTWMASHCSGAFLLAEAGVLDGKKATTWAGGEKGLQEAYPKIKVQLDVNVVLDEKVITTNGGLVSYQGSFELLKQMSSEKNAKEISEMIQFNRLESAFKQ